MNIHFSNALELKQYLMPVLRLRKREFIKQNVQITEDEIWSYLVDSFWKQSTQLSLTQMVDDILNRQITKTMNEI